MSTTIVQISPPAELREIDFPKLQAIAAIPEGERYAHAASMDLLTLGRFIQPAVNCAEALVAAYRPYILNFRERTAHQGKQKLLTDGSGKKVTRDELCNQTIGVGIRRLNQLLRVTDPDAPKPKPPVKPQPKPKPFPKKGDRFVNDGRVFELVCDVSATDESPKKNRNGFFYVSLVLREVTAAIVAEAEPAKAGIVTPQPDTTVTPAAGLVHIRKRCGGARDSWTAMCNYRALDGSKYHFHGLLRATNDKHDKPNCPACFAKREANRVRRTHAIDVKGRTYCSQQPEGRLIAAKGMIPPNT